MSEPSYKLDPRFIEGKKGRLYTLHYRPVNMGDDTECFIVAPAFAEEMNRCRYMCTMFAQAIASLGYGFLSVDAYGTGDSEGDFRELEWDQLGDDLLTACDYMAQQGYAKISLLGIRMGALQVMQVAPRVPGLHRIIFWQPVAKGNAALTQLLRLKIAGSLNREESAGSTRDFEKRVENGESVEVTGYEISPNLFRGIKGASLADSLAFNHVPIGWFTTIASENRKPGRAEAKLLEQWRESGATIDYTVVVDPPFWQVHERTLAPNLVAATVDYIAGKQAL